MYVILYFDPLRIFVLARCSTPFQTSLNRILPFTIITSFIPEIELFTALSSFALQLKLKTSRSYISIELAVS